MAATSMVADASYATNVLAVSTATAIAPAAAVASALAGFVLSSVRVLSSKQKQHPRRRPLRNERICS